MKIKIWSEDNSIEEDAHEIEVLGYPTIDQIWSNIEYQVRQYAEKDHQKNDYWETSTFCVIVGEELRRYDVQVHMEPRFYVAVRKPKSVPA